MNDRILFAAGTGADTSQIFVIDPDGTHKRQLTNGPGLRGGPVASPDGKTIAFASRDEADHSYIYLMDADGGRPVQLTSGPVMDQEPNWSPDGTRLVFERSLDFGQTDLYLIKPDGGSLTRLTETDSLYEDSPAWSPDGVHIAVTGFGPEDGDRNIYLVDVNDGAEVRLADLPGEDLDPAWSPDGSQLAFSNETEPGIGAIYVMAADGSGPVAVTGGQVRDFSPGWAPGADRLVLSRVLLDTPGDVVADVYVLTLGGGALDRLTRSERGAITPSWTGAR